MKTNDQLVVAPEVLADLEAVCQQVNSGGVKDSQLLQRVQERAQQTREEMLQQFGVQEIGVQIIREMREGR